MDIYDNKLIIRSEMEKFLNISLYQNYIENLSIENIINSIFPLDANFMEFNALYSCILFKKHLFAVFKHLLQYNENNNQNGGESSN